MSDWLREGVGELVRHRRKQLGTSQATLAEECGVSRPQISNIEAGRSAPSLDLLWEMAFALGCQPGVLLPPLNLDREG